MPLRRLALVCLATCTPGPELHVDVADRHEAVSPVPKDSPTVAVPKASPAPAAPVPAASSAPAAPPLTSLGAPVPGVDPTRLRLLHPGVYTHAPLADGTLLVAPRPVWVQQGGKEVATGDTGLHRLDLTTGTLTPWSQDWNPESAGWRTRESEWGPGTPEVSADGQLVVAGHSFAARTLPPDHRAELTAIVVSRGDGSEARCIGIGVPSDDPPPYYMSRTRQRLIGDWTLECAPDRRGRPVPLHPDRPDTFLVSMPWLDLDDGSHGELPYRFVFAGRDPLGDRVVDHFADVRGVGLESFDIATGTVFGASHEDEGQDFRDPRWVSADAVLVDVTTEQDVALGQRLIYSDGHSLDLRGPRWQVYTRLPGDQLLYSRDDGRSVEQARIDWTTQTAIDPRPRPELNRFTNPDPLRVAPDWQPGLGGVRIYEHEAGALYLAAIGP